MLTEKEQDQIKDAALEITSYVELAQAYIDNNLAINEMVHLGLLIDKMEENTQVFKKIYKLL